MEMGRGVGGAVGGSRCRRREYVKGRKTKKEKDITKT